MQEALAFGMVPTPLSVRYQDDERRGYGLVLNVMNRPGEGFEASAQRLKALLKTCG